MSRLDTEDWRLSCFMEWTPKKQPYSITCPGCNGKGQIGGHFKDIDGPRECPQCFGTSYITHPGPATPKPELPPELVEHMRQAWQAFFADASPPVPHTEAAQKPGETNSDGEAACTNCKDEAGGPLARWKCSMCGRDVPATKVQK